jgi:hypothetical protein
MKMNHHWINVKKLAAVLVIVPALLLSTMAQAEAVGAAAAEEAVIMVDVIVNIDKASRAITLKDEDGIEWAFVAGPEVDNFEQLQRGDLVIMTYYAGTAVALEPKGSGLEERASEIEAERAAPGDKPGMKVTETTYMVAKVTAVDTKHRFITLQGVGGSLRLEVGDDIDLADVDVGQEVEALYTESVAVAAEPAPKVSGTVSMKITAVALGIGAEWGKGTLTLYDGTSHEFKVSGLSLADVGAAEVEATGEVYHLVEARDLEGSFIAGEAGGALVGGGAAVAAKNEHGVVIKLKSRQQGVRLTLAGEALKIKLR